VILRPGYVFGLGKRELSGRVGIMFHNTISYGIAKLAEFLDDDVQVIMATAHRSPQLGDTAASDLLDELRVLLKDKYATTALFCFSLSSNRR